MSLLSRGEEVGDRVGRGIARQRRVMDRQASELLDRAAGIADRQLAMVLERASRLADRLDTISTDVTRRSVEAARRVNPRPKPRRGPMLTALALGAAAGYLVAWLTDREQGRARRAEIGRQLGLVKLEVTRAAQRTVTVAGDRASGIRSRVTGPDNPDPDDLTLLDRVESEVFADPSIPKGQINVMVIDGKAVLRGQVEEPQIGSIEQAVRKVVGVRDVENLLHTAGTPAPNKAAARSAGNGGAAPSEH